MADEDVVAGPEPFLGFFNAESAATHAVDAIVSEGGKVLYQKYIEKKSFGFAAQVVCDELTSYLEMCFVPRDHGEENYDDWAQEPEPEQIVIDSWARSCVPKRVRKIVVNQDSPVTKTLSPAEKRAQNRKVRNRLEKQNEEAKTDVAMREPVKLKDEWVGDENEEALRDLKDKQDKQKKEDQARLQQVEQQAQEESAKVAQSKAVDKGKPCTFDFRRKPYLHAAGAGGASAATQPADQIQFWQGHRS